MDKNSLYRLMEANGFVSGDLLCHYAFSGASGSLLFNEAHEVSGSNWMSGHFLDWPLTGKIDADKTPGISRKNTNITSTSDDFDGSGYFKGDDVVTVGTGVPSDSWTAFISFSGTMSDDIKNLSNVILSTNNSPEDTSGFFVGRNHRSLFIENYDNTNSVQNAQTHSRELLEKNIISISKTKLNQVAVSVYDSVDATKNYTEAFSIKGYNNSDQINIGGFLNNQNNVLGYTGFSGYLDQFLLLTGNLKDQEKVDIVKSFYASNYSKPAYVTQETSFISQSGVELVTGVFDTGVTGYENALVRNLSTSDGSFSLYRSSGVEGEITGSFYSGVPGTGTETIKSTVYQEESYSYSQQDVESYSPSIVSFKNSQTGAYEIYSRPVKSDTIDLTAEYDKVEKNFSVDSVFTGIESNNQIGLIYANGYLLESGNSNTGMYTRVDDFSINASGYSGIDNVIYDLVTTDSNGQVQFEVTSEQATGLRFTDGKYLTKDIYFEGVKLLSGEHWSGSYADSFIDVVQSSFGAGIGVDQGTLTFVPTADSFVRLTGQGATRINTNLNLINEQVWVDGIRQIRDKDYYLVSSESNLNSTSRQNPVENILYSGQTGFYNV